MLHQDFWLTPDGVVEMSAAEHAKEGKRALMEWDEFYPIPDPFKKLTAAEAKDGLKRGIDPAIIAFLKDGGDSRKWMMQHGGWVRTARNIIQFWKLDEDTLKLIRNWLRSMKVEEWETFEMEELSTNTTFTAQAKQLKRLGITKEALMAYGTGVGRFRNPPKVRLSAEVEGVWASPSGEIYPVVEHLLAISEKPELFDLPQSLRGVRDVSVLRDAAESLIENGWTRYRYLSGVYAFEVDTFVRRRSIIEQILQGVGAFESEQVTISQMKPREEFEGTVEDVYAHRVGRFAANPGNNRWRFT